MSNPLLLDTHIWIWLANGDKSLSNRAYHLIEKSAAKGEVFASVISAWEIAMLEAKKRITLNSPCLDWIKKSSHLTGIQLLPLSVEIAVESSHLPGDFHGDPADRLIVATSRLESFTLLTKDENIIRYGKKHYIDVFKV